MWGGVLWECGFRGCGLVAFAADFGFLWGCVMLARLGFSGGGLTMLSVFVCALGLLL